MKVVILTSANKGICSRTVPVLARNKDIDLLAVVYAQGMQGNRIKFAQRKLKKILRIGLFGAINGIRIRSWFRDEDAPDIEIACLESNVKLISVSSINCEATAKVLETLGADLGISLGNSYISQKIFAIPKYGMINVHGELLPEYKGGLSVLWPIYFNSRRTGFTIHQIDKGIDTGSILYRDEYDVVFGSSLRETVVKTLAIGRKRIPHAVTRVCADYFEFLENQVSQTRGGSFTTPTFLQFLRMIANHKRLQSVPDGRVNSHLASRQPDQ